MDTLVERLTALPRHWLAVGGATVVVVAMLIAFALTGGDDGSAIESAPTPAASAVGTTTSVAATTTDGGATTDVTTTGADRPSTTTPQSGPVATVSVNYQPPVESDDAVPGVEGRTIPDEPPDEPPPVTVAPPPWAASTRTTEGGHLAVDVGCVEAPGAQPLDAFFSRRVGPVLGWDYQHVYPLGGDRSLWLFQDAFLDHTGTKTTLGSSRFIHNVAMLQRGLCFTLLHRGTTAAPLPFEVGDGTVDTRTKWLWPMGGELVGDQLYVFWAEMIKDPYDPDPPDGLGWHPRQVFLATYDAVTLERLSWESPRNRGVVPIYGYAVASDATHTYLFGNTFEQNMIREGGFWNGPHSATRMYLARVPRGKITEWPEYRTADGWSYEPSDAVPIVERYYAENPMQPRYLDGQWVAVTAVDGYWGDALAIDVADQPWGPWMTVSYGELYPRNADPKMNTYHAHLLPERDGFGSIQITVSNNARNMLRDAWNDPYRYRPMVTWSPFTPTPAPTTTTTSTTTSTTTTVPPTTTPSTSTTSTSTTSSTSTSTTSTSTTTTVPQSTTSTTSTTTTSTSTSTSTSTTSTSTTSTTTPETTQP